MKVVSGIDSGDRGICQNPELASSLEKTFAPASWPSTWSTDGNGCLSLHTLLFNRVKSTQIRTFPFDLGATTMPAHQSVGSWIFWMTPCDTILSSSAFTLFLRGIGTLLGVVRA